MIQIEHLTKRYGSRTAVDDITCTVHPGKVTGFLGPNGAGKSTTMRMIVGLDRPSSGRVRVNGRAYPELAAPMHEVGALLDARAAHPGRTAESHLRGLAATHGIGRRRVAEVIALTGIESVARRRIGGFSLGMGQRLGIAAALLGDPAVLILDEPVNGLDPEGVLWVRRLARDYAAEGRTVLLSSHLMSEMAQTADHVIVLGRGRIVADDPLDALTSDAGRASVRVRSPRADELAALLTAPEVHVTSRSGDLLEVRGLDAVRLGDTAAAAGIALHELTPVTASLEDAYLALTQDEVEYRMEIAR